MNRDPFYQSIVDGLKEVKDDKLFEHCAADLLRAEWPNIVPIPGGDDAGLDGAWSDDQGPGGLVVTTSPNVIGNVTKNLRMQLRKGGRRRQVLVATTQNLSPRQCRNIEKRVRELNFQLAHHPYTQQAIADRLHHNSHWCLKLLGISGRPPALSKIPKGLRPFRDLPLLHREEEYKWIESGKGDLVLVGQPGVGKTYLLQEYVNRGHALFVTDNDLTRITDGIRDQQPSALIIEDAHQCMVLIQELQRYRAETGLQFDILADCWPASRDDVFNALNVGPASCRTLARLSPEQIVDIVNAAGIGGPNWLVADLIRQSGGNPGRAAMLAHICITDGVESIWEGSALARWVRTTFSQLVGEGCIRVIATFAFGGKAGMGVNAVASVLGYPVGQVLDWIAKLNFGGIVQDLGRGSFRVLPEPLRFVLVKEYFFDQHSPLSIEELMESTNSYESALQTLIGARSRGAGISTDSLIQWLELSSSQRLWADFIQIDVAHAHVVLDRFPEKIEDLARPLLQMAPERTIPHLLRLAVGDGRRTDSTTDHPLRLIHDWIESCPQGISEPVRRRKALWVSVRDWLLNGGDRAIGAQALVSVLSPDHDRSEMVAGKRMVSVTRGSVNARGLTEIAGLWIEVFETMRRVDLNEWPIIFSAIDPWVYWTHPSLSLPDELRSIRNATAKRMLTDLVGMADNRPGIQKELQRRCADIGVPLQFQIDEEYAVLFPEEDFEVDWKIRRRNDEDRVKVLAANWSSKNPRDICASLMRFVRESKASGRPYPDYSEYCCSLIAGDACDVQEWLVALMDAGGESRHILPFLDRIVNERLGDWKERATECLHSETGKFAAVVTLLKCSDIEPTFLNEVYEASKRFPRLVENLCMNGQLIEERIGAFLESSDSGLAEAAASGLWHREPRGSISDQMKSGWRRAVISSVTDEYDLCEMMRADREMAYGWLMDRAINDRDSYFRERKAYTVAAEQLTDAERRKVVDNLNSENYCAVDLVTALVGTSRQIYEYVLSNEHLKWQHLAPLRRKPTSEWCALACLAFNSGYTPRDIVSAAFQGTDSVSWGPISSRHESQLEEWTRLAAHEDSRIREVARIGEESARQQIEFWQKIEKSDEIEDYFD